MSKTTSVVKDTTLENGDKFIHCGDTLTFIRKLPSGNWITNKRIVHQEDEITLIIEAII